MTRSHVARPSLGKPDSVWIELAPDINGNAVGAHLTLREAMFLAGELAAAVAEINRRHLSSE